HVLSKDEHRRPSGLKDLVGLLAPLTCALLFARAAAELGEIVLPRVGEVFFERKSGDNRRCPCKEENRSSAALDQASDRCEGKRQRGSHAPFPASDAGNEGDLSRKQEERSEPATDH